MGEGGSSQDGRIRRPPRLGNLVLRLIPDGDREFIAGDIEERFRKRLDAGISPLRVWLRYWRDVLGSVCAFAVAWFAGGRGAQADDRATAGSSPGRSPRDAGGWRTDGPFGGIASDVWFGVRALRKRPAYALLAIGTLGIGIGATTAVFSMANVVMLRPLPGIADTEGLAVIEFVAEGAADRATGVSLPDLDMLRGLSSFSGLAGNARIPMQFLTPSGEAHAALGEAVAGDYFELLGVRASVGRLLAADELGPGSDPTVAVISEPFHSRAFGGDPAVVGRTLQVNGQTLTVIGVAGSGFRGAELRLPIDVWVPISAYTALRHFEGYDINRPGHSFFQQLYGRLADGTTVEAAQAELRSVFAGLVESDPDTYDEYAVHLPTVYPGIGIEPMARDRVAAAIALMFGVVGLVLLIACANVANLLLFRGVHRRGELAVRRALGASRGRVARQSLVESMLLGIGGAIVGLLVAHGTMELVSGTTILRLPAFDSFTLDLRVLGFAAAAAVVTAALFGAAPALAAARSDPARALRDAGGTGRRARLRTGLSAVQLALSMTLMVSALLLLRTIRNLYDVDIGFDPSATMAFRINPEPQGYDDAEALALYDRLIERVRELPGVEAASASQLSPFVGSRFSTRVRESDDVEPTSVAVDFIAPGFFASLGVPLLRGRDLTPSDMAGGGGVIINQSLAEALFAGSDPIGRSVLGTFLDGDTRTVVGVIPDIRYHEPGSPSGPMLFEPLSHGYSTSGSLLVRGTRGTDIRSAVLDIVRAVDPAIPVTRVHRLSEGIDERLAEQRLFARLLVTFAAVALFLSAVGLYGLIAHSVARRTREIGVRVALGAWRGGIARLVLGEAATVAAIGIAFGLAGAFAFGRLIRSLLYGVAPGDPLTWLMASVVFAAVTFVAALSPALAATRVDPVRALRTE